MSLLSQNYQSALNDTYISLQTLQDKDVILLLENIIRGSISSVMGDKNVSSDENKKSLYLSANNLYRISSSQPLSYYEIEMCMLILIFIRENWKNF